MPPTCLQIAAYGYSRSLKLLTVCVPGPITIETNIIMVSPDVNDLKNDSTTPKSLTQTSNALNEGDTAGLKHILVDGSVRVYKM